MADKPGDKDPKRAKKSTMFGIAPPPLPGAGGKQARKGTLQGMPSAAPPAESDEPELIIEPAVEEVILDADGEELEESGSRERAAPPPPLPGGKKAPPLPKSPKAAAKPAAPAPGKKAEAPAATDGPPTSKFLAAKPATADKPNQWANVVTGKLPALGLRTILPADALDPPSPDANAPRGAARSTGSSAENELLKPRPMPAGFFAKGGATTSKGAPTEGAPPSEPAPSPEEEALLSLDLSPLDRPTGPPVKLALDAADAERDAWGAVSAEPRTVLSAIPSLNPPPSNDRVTTPPPPRKDPEKPAARELVSRSRPPSGRVDLAHEMRDRFALDDFTGALRSAELVLGRDPGNKEADGVAKASRERLAQLYISRIGSLSSVPMVMVPDAEVRWLGLDHRAGFLLSRIDGVATVDELVDVSGMGRLEALKILAELLEAKAIRFTRG